MDSDRMTRYLDSIPTFGAPGVDCIVQQEGKTVYRHMAGLSDREAGTPMTGKERFNLYSATKAITCTAALQLYEQGAFLLTDPVSKYLPEFDELQVKVGEENGRPILAPAQKKMTVRNLFTMTGGLGYDTGSPVLLNAAAKTQGRAPTREMVRAMASMPLYYEPGEHWRYSLAHDVLGALIEVWSGMRFGEYLQKNIFEPLGMTRTGFSRTQEDLADVMQQYRRDPVTGEITVYGMHNQFVFGTEYESGGAGLLSCVDDYIRFVSAMANGGVGETGARILHANTIDLMRENQLDAAQMKDFNWVQFVGYGYGLGVRTLVSRAVSGSPGPLGEFGWGGAAGCYVLIDPQNHLGMFYAQHMLNSLEPVIHPRLRNILYSSL